MNLRALGGKSRRVLPRWSIKTLFVAALTILIIASAIILLVVKRTIWEELEIIVGVLALAMWAFFTMLLYRGVRLDKRERLVIDWPKGHALDYVDPVVVADSGWLFTDAGAEAGILGLVIGFLLDLLLSIVLMFLVALLLWVGVNLIVGLVLALALPLFHVFRRITRTVVAKGRACRGKIGQSAVQAGIMALLYTFWVYAVFFGAHHLSEWIKR